MASGWKRKGKKKMCDAVIFDLWSNLRSARLELLFSTNSTRAVSMLTAFNSHIRCVQLQGSLASRLSWRATGFSEFQKLI